LVEFRARQLSTLDDVTVEPTFHERRLPRSPNSPFAVNWAVCVQVDAINDAVSARLVRSMQTHLRLTGMPLGPAPADPAIAAVSWSACSGCRRKNCEMR
jgi:hypothetical protein